MSLSKKMWEEQRELELSDLGYRNLPVTKSAIAVQATRAVDNILESGNPLQVAETLSAIAEFIKTVKEDKRLVDYVREELNKEKGKHQTVNGTKIECAEVGTKYNYSNCNDPILKDLETEQEQLGKVIKIRQDFLKCLPPAGMDVRIEDQLVTIFPPSKSSTSSFKTTLKGE